jgi:hypothetical protein
LVGTSCERLIANGDQPLFSWSPLWSPLRTLPCDLDWGVKECDSDSPCLISVRQRYRLAWILAFVVRSQTESPITL